MTTASITTRTRNMVQDTGRPFVAGPIMTDGTTTIFDLPVESISQTAYPPVVTLNGVVQPNSSATPQFIFDYKHGVIVWFTAPATGQSLVVSGWTYQYFDDDEVEQAVVDGFNMHVAGQEPLPELDPLPGQLGISSNDENMVSILAAIELYWMLAAASAFDVDISTPEGVSVPRSQRYRQVADQIARWQQMYEHYSNALGTGMFRIQVLFQRRVSYTTNRLVPLFREQEYNTPYTGFYPTAAPVGGLVTLYGQYFTGATSVGFGGVQTTNFTVVSDSIIQATVPAGAVTGQIQITTPYGTVLSTAAFVVGQPAPYMLYGPEQVQPDVPSGLNSTDPTYPS